MVEPKVEKGKLVGEVAAGLILGYRTRPDGKVEKVIVNDVALDGKLLGESGLKEPRLIVGDIVKERQDLNERPRWLSDTRLRTLEIALYTEVEEIPGKKA